MSDAIKFLLGLLGLVALIAPPAHGQEARGNWSGTLELGGGARLRLVVHIQAGESGTLQGTLDSLDQGAFGIPLADVAAASRALSFAVPAVAGRYEGRWDSAAGGWAGRWSQNGASWPLNLDAAAPPPAPPPLPADWTIPDDAAIARLIEARIAARPGAGIVVGVIEPSGRRLVARGPAGAAPFGGGTLFEIGSMSKLFTALLLADMARRGEVALDDPAARYLPAGAALPERAGRRITLADLATHRSGLPRLPDNFAPRDADNPYADFTEARLLAFLGSYRLTRDIGGQYEYSNLGMGLLGYLLSRRAGTGYEALVRERIAGPLAMRDTVVVLSPAQQARFALGHDAFMRPAPAWDIPVLAGAGALRSTGDDLLTFLAAALGDGPAPLTASMRAMTARRWPGPRPLIETGLGWMMIGQIAFHDGGTGGFRTAIAFDAARRRGIVILTNATVEPSANDLALHLLTGAPLAPVQPVPVAPNAARTAIQVPAGQLDRLTGRYVFSPTLAIAISREGDRLMAQVANAPRLRIYAETPLDFFWREIDAQLRFVPEADGRIGGVVFRQGGIELNGRRAP